MPVCLTMLRHLAVLFVLLASLSGCTAITQTMKATSSLMNFYGVVDMPMKELEKRYLNEESEWMEVDGVRIHYRDQGEGPAIVLVHGVMSSLHTWDGWTEELSKNFRVISLDVPGFGMTGALPEDPLDLSPNGIHRMIAEYVPAIGNPGPSAKSVPKHTFSEETLLSLFSKFIDRLELDRFSIAGNSLGGYMAATYAADNPGRVEKLILLAPIGYPQDTPWIFDFATLPVISTIGRYASPPLFVTLNVREVYGDPARLSRANLERYIHLSQRAGAKSAYIDTMMLLKARSNDDRPLPFHKIQAPTLLMWGELDRWVPLELATHWQNDIRNVQLITYPDAGHVPMEEIPDQTVADAVLFLGEFQAQTPSSSVRERARSVDELRSILEAPDASSSQPRPASMSQPTEPAPQSSDDLLLEDMAPLEL